MIEFDRLEFNNGLKVLVHEDASSPLAAMNILYNVGARDEDPDKTGFAHLFEHLMFGGSVNVPSYDEPLQQVGGENNAFTNNDITNYYLTLPATNLETGFWLESDRMLSLDFSEKSLEVQRSVVIEEFKQRYLNQPYGDVWLLLRPLVYKVHPYQWPTIGKKIEHIEDATLEDVKDFFHRFYCPDNAVMVVSGQVKTAQVERLTNKWFSEIPSGNVALRNLPVEPVQTEERRLVVERDVPTHALYIAYHMGSRLDADYHTADLITDILSRGKSSRLHQNLIKKKRLFTEISAYITGSTDNGLLVVSGKPAPGVSLDEAEAAVLAEIDLFQSRGVDEGELLKVQNKVESTLVFRK